MDGWWCVRYGDALAWVDPPSEAAAVRRSLDLHPLGDWTYDTRRLVVFPQDAYPDHSGPHDYTRAVLSANPHPLRVVVRLGAGRLSHSPASQARSWSPSLLPPA